MELYIVERIRSLLDTKMKKVLVPQSELLPGGEVGHNSWNPNLCPHKELVLCLP